MQRSCEATESHVIAVGCNGNSNPRPCNFEGKLFDNHTCPLCGQHAPALLHVCPELVLKHSYDKLCCNCSVRALQTSKAEKNKVFWLQQRHHTPLMTAIFGIAVLEEITNIICITRIEECYEFQNWNWRMSFEKKLLKTGSAMAELDLEIIISYNNEAKIYIAGKTKLLIVCCVYLTKIYIAGKTKLLIVCCVYLTKIYEKLTFYCFYFFHFYHTVEMEMSTVKSFSNQINNRWKYFFGNGNVYSRQESYLLHLAFAFQRSNKRDEADENRTLLSLLSSATRRTELFDYSKIITALVTNQKMYFFYHIDIWNDKFTIRRQNTSGKMFIALTNNELKRTVFDFDSLQTSMNNIQRLDVSLYWIKQALMLLEDQTNLPKNNMKLWRRQYGMCAICDSYLYPPEGEGMSCFSENFQEIALNQTKTKQRSRLLFNSISSKMCVPVSDYLLEDESTLKVMLVCLDCYKITMKLPVTETVLSHVSPYTKKTIENDKDLFLYLAHETGLIALHSIYIISIDNEDEEKEDWQHKSTKVFTFATNLKKSMVFSHIIPLTMITNNNIKYRIKNGIAFRNTYEIATNNFELSKKKCDDDVVNILKNKLQPAVYNPIFADILYLLLTTVNSNLDLNQRLEQNNTFIPYNNYTNVYIHTITQSVCMIYIGNTPIIKKHSCEIMQNTCNVQTLLIEHTNITHHLLFSSSDTFILRAVFDSADKQIYFRRSTNWLNRQNLEFRDSKDQWTTVKSPSFQTEIKLWKQFSAEIFKKSKKTKYTMIYEKMGSKNKYTAKQSFVNKIIQKPVAFADDFENCQYWVFIIRMVGSIILKDIRKFWVHDIPTYHFFFAFWNEFVVKTGLKKKYIENATILGVCTSEPVHFDYVGIFEKFVIFFSQFSSVHKNISPTLHINTLQEMAKFNNKLMHIANIENTLLTPSKQIFILHFASILLKLTDFDQFLYTWRTQKDTF